MKPGRMYAAMIPGSRGEFWAVIGPYGPVAPRARSKEEFELKLAVEGMELTGREAAPAETGLPARFCADYMIRTFEIGMRDGPG